MADRNYYMVRAMSSNEDDFKEFFDNSVVAVGWSDVDFTKYKDSQALREAIKEAYYKNSDIAPQALSKKLNQVERFSNIKEGDYVIVPYWSNIAIAEAGADHIYSEEAKNLDLANQIKVKYVKDKDGNILKIPRYNLENTLQKRLRVRGNTVADLWDFRNEIERIFDKRDEYSYENGVREAEEAKKNEFKAKLLSNLRSGGTNLKAGGVGLEELVCELLICEGYDDATVLPKRAYEEGTDADIKATRTDSFIGDETVFVQVKHHGGKSDAWGIKQLKKVMELEGDCKGVFVTSASVDSPTMKEADLANIKVIQGEQLVDIIVDNLDNLNESTKRTLGICEVPFLVTDLEKIN